MMPTTRVFLLLIPVLVCALTQAWSSENGVSAQNVGGTLDPTFSGDGLVIESCGTLLSIRCERPVSAMALQPDGHFVLAEGGSSFRLRRYTSDGEFDSTFATTTIVFSDNGNANDVAVLGDGKIVAVGAVTNGTGFAIARYLSNGTLDATFGTNGTLVVPMGYGSAGAKNIVVQSDGKWLISGWAAWLPNAARYFAISRLLPSGQLDTSFGTNGRVYTRFAGHATPSGLAVDMSGRIIMAGLIEETGSVARAFAVVRYLSNGAVDTSFGMTGRAIARGPQVIFARALAVQDDGRIIVGGTAGTPGASLTYRFALLRWTADGALDQSFGTGGIVSTTFPSGRSELNVLVLQSDGKLVAGGQADVTTSSTMRRMALARYLPDGTLDSSFGSDGLVTVTAGREAWVTDLVIQPDAKIVAAGAQVTISLDLTTGGPMPGMARFLP